MKHVQHSLRLPPNLDMALRQLAATRQRSQYSLLGECVRVGLATLSGGEKPAQSIYELVHEVGAVRAELAHAQRLIERAIYISCAAYVYSRAGAAGRVDEAKVARETSDAFDRQIRAAGGE